MSKFVLACCSILFCAACSEFAAKVEETSTASSEIVQPETPAEPPAEIQANAASILSDGIGDSSNQDNAESGIKLDSLIPETRYQVLGSAPSESPTQPLAATEKNDTASLVIKLCQEIGAKLGSVDESDCLRQRLETAGGRSLQGRDLAIKNYLPTNARAPLGRVLVIGGIHGDEFSSVSVVFKWMDILNEHHSGLFNWRFIPASNPDGLLNKISQRQNANGVDLNRNFPTADWGEKAKDHWVNNAYMQARRYPGESANSEPETQWLVAQINEFQPDVIVSMHAPYHLVDYDGPPKAPGQLGSLYLRKLGVFPGSLGNYAGVDLGIPIVTVELASAGSMPSKNEISDMWDDLVRWLRTKLEE